MQLISLYLHIPFCLQRCSYCDFNTYTDLGWLIPEYVDALCTEAEIISKSSCEKIELVQYILEVEHLPF
jgi:oxygen-independent coproporphyrinogen III oxidase